MASQHHRSLQTQHAFSNALGRSPPSCSGICCRCCVSRPSLSQTIAAGMRTQQNKPAALTRTEIRNVLKVVGKGIASCGIAKKAVVNAMGAMMESVTAVTMWV